VDRFEVGEVAILIQPDDVGNSGVPGHGVPRGSEVTVISTIEYLPMRMGGESRGIMAVHRITDQAGRLWGCPPSWLRKKRPPEADRKREELGEWDLCPWKPETVKCQHPSEEVRQ
jgi:hypothetical protein